MVKSHDKLSKLPCSWYEICSVIVYKKPFGMRKDIDAKAYEHTGNKIAFGPLMYDNQCTQPTFGCSSKLISLRIVFVPLSAEENISSEVGELCSGLPRVNISNFTPK